MNVCLTRIIDSLANSNGSLRKIDLSGNPISNVIPDYNETLTEIIEGIDNMLQGLQYLEGFDISGMLLGSQLVQKIKNTLLQGCSALRYFNLSNNNLTQVDQQWFLKIMGIKDPSTTEG